MVDGHCVESVGTGSQVDPETILPEQFFAVGRSADSGPLALWRAVLLDGIRTFCAGILTNTRRELAYREVEHWIFHSEANVASSFTSLCDLFDIDSSLLRKRLREFRDRPTGAVREALEGMPRNMAPVPRIRQAA